MSAAARLDSFGATVRQGETRVSSGAKMLCHPVVSCEAACTPAEAEPSGRSGTRGFIHTLGMSLNRISGPRTRPSTAGTVVRCAQLLLRGETAWKTPGLLAVCAVMALEIT